MVATISVQLQHKRSTLYETPLIEVQTTTHRRTSTTDSGRRLQCNLGGGKGGRQVRNIADGRIVGRGFPTHLWGSAQCGRTQLGLDQLPPSARARSAVACAGDEPTVARVDPRPLRDVSASVEKCAATVWPLRTQKFHCVSTERPHCAATAYPRAPLRTHSASPLCGHCISKSRSVERAAYPKSSIVYSPFLVVYRFPFTLSLPCLSLLSSRVLLDAE